MTQLNSYACTLVPTVFLRNRETEFELQFRFSFLRFYLFRILPELEE